MGEPMRFRRDVSEAWGDRIRWAMNHHFANVQDTGGAQAWLAAVEAWSMVLPHRMMLAVWDELRRLWRASTGE